MNLLRAINKKVEPSDPDLQGVKPLSVQYIVCWTFLMLAYVACMAGLGHLLEWW